jgi:MFS family permease
VHYRLPELIHDVWEIAVPTTSGDIERRARVDITQTLEVTRTSLEMIVAIYGVAFAVCLPMAGHPGDNFGRRQLFGIGVAVFAIASQLCGLANSIWVLLTARADFVWNRTRSRRRHIHLRLG